jgi:type IV secretion system protein VirD4
MWWKLTLAILVLMAFCFLGGLYVGGGIFLAVTGGDFRTVTYMTLISAGDFSMTDRQLMFLPWSWCVTIAITFLPLLLAIFVWFLGKTKKTSLHGNARFATDKELKVLEYTGSYQGKETPYSPENPQKRIEKYPPILLGKHPNKDVFLASYGQTFMMLAAPPGSGKGVGSVIPNLLTYPESVVVNDPKFENWELTAGFRAYCGQECYRFSPELMETHRWNPLSRISRDPLYALGEIRTTAAVFYTPDNPRNGGWYKKAGDVFTAIVLFLIETPALPCSLPQVYEISALGEGLGEWAKTQIDKRSSGKDALSNECLRELNRIVSESKNKQGWPTVLGILNERLSMYGEKTIAYAVSGDDIQFDQARQKKMSIYFCVTNDAITKFAPLMNLFFTQAISENSKVLPEQGGHCADGSLRYKYQILCLMDETAVMGVIEKMKTAPALTRGAGLRYIIIFQGKAQLRSSDLYGLEGANAIMDAFHIETVYAPGNIDAATEYSKRLGNTTVRVASYSDNYGEKKSRTKSYSEQARPLMLPQEVNELPYGEELIFVQPTKTTPALNIKARKIFWYEEPGLKERAGMPTPPIPKGDAAIVETLVVPMMKQDEKTTISSPHDKEIQQEQDKRKAL